VSPTRFYETLAQLAGAASRYWNTPQAGGTFVIVPLFGVASADAPDVAALVGEQTGRHWRTKSTRGGVTGGAVRVMPFMQPA